MRTKRRTYTVKQQVFISIGILFFGICLGTFAKYLDYRHAKLPWLLKVIDGTLDFHNFLGSFALWILIAVCIAVYSQTPIRSAINVFVFFVGMVSGYYVYCNYVAGFFPKSYAMIWVGFTIISPILAFICWYAKGKGTVAIIISAGIIGVFISIAFAFGMFYISISSWLKVIVLLVAILVLRRPVKEMIAVVGIGILLAVIMDILMPFSIW